MLIASLPCRTAVAAPLNVPVAARVISFLQPPPTGPISIAIIYQPGNAASEAEADQIERVIGSGMTVGRARLTVRRLSSTNIGQLSGVRAAFLTVGLRAHQDEIARVTASQSVVTITSDIACVTAGQCVIGIRNRGRTEIVVSRAATRQHRVRFGSAFLMLVKEI